MASGEFRLRLCYPKGGRLRWLSHLEVVHALERAVRRSGLPYAVTHGFNPHLKAAFGPALAVGTGSEKEYLDVYLTRYTTAEEALRRLAAASPEDLAPTEARYVPDGTPALTAVISVAAYEVGLDAEGDQLSQVQAALDRRAAAGDLVVEHKGKTKVFDLARALRKELRARVGEGGKVTVDISVRIGPEGSLRPDVFVRHALAAAQLSTAVTSVTRADAFIEDETGQWLRPI